MIPITILRAAAKDSFGEGTVQSMKRAILDWLMVLFEPPKFTTSLVNYVSGGSASGVRTRSHTSA
jgi:hypothetical protein